MRYGFATYGKDLQKTYKRTFTYRQWKMLSKHLGFPLEATPTELTFEQWLGPYRCFMERVPDIKREGILGRWPAGTDSRRG